MAIAVTNKIQAVSDTDATSYTTASFTAAAGRILLLTVDTRRTSAAPPAPTISDSGLGTVTWTQIGSTLFSSDNHRVTLFVGTGASGTGTVTASIAGANGLTWGVIIDELSGVDTSSPYVTSNVATNTGAAVSALTVTLPNAFADATNNLAYGTFGTSVRGTALTAGSGFTISGEAASGAENLRLGSEYRVGQDLTVDISGGTGAWGGVAVEIKAATAVTGTLSTGLSALVLAATAMAAVVGAATPTLGAMTTSSGATLAVSGAGAPVLDAVTAASPGTVAVAGSAAPTLGAVMLAATGTAGGDVVGTLEATLASLSGGVAGAIAVDGDLAEVLAPVATTASGGVSVVGTSVSTLGAVTLGALGAVAVDGVLDGALATAALDGVGGTGREGALAATLETLIVTASGSAAGVGEAPAVLQVAGGAVTTPSYPISRPRVRLRADGSAEALVVAPDAALVIAPGPTRAVRLTATSAVGRVRATHARGAVQAGVSRPVTLLAISAGGRGRGAPAQMEVVDPAQQALALSLLGVI